MTNEISYKAGDKMILRHKDNACKLQTVNIDRLTKRQIIVKHPTMKNGEVIRFEMDAGQHSCHDEVGFRKGWSSSKWLLYDFSNEAFADVKELVAAKEEAKMEKQRQQEEKTRKANERHAEELAEVKACGCLLDRIKLSRHFPDGSRLYALDIPVKPEYVERKKGYETVIVRCKDFEDYDFEKGQEWLKSIEMEKKNLEHHPELEEEYETACTVKRVNFAITYCNGETHSFASMSSQKADTDEEALWEAIRSCYHSW